MPEGVTIDTIPEQDINDCAQLVKENSIQGKKMATVDVIYTLWSNLRKGPEMDVGTIGFHDERQVTHTQKKRR